MSDVTEGTPVSSFRPLVPEHPSRYIELLDPVRGQACVGAMPVQVLARPFGSLFPGAHLLRPPLVDEHLGVLGLRANVMRP
jgi:hypothetical protein